MFKKYLSLSLFILISFVANAQQIVGNSDDDFNEATPKEYELGGVTVNGTQFLDNTVLINLSGLIIGDKIEVPGEKVTKAIRNLWEQNLFSDISIITLATKYDGNLLVFLLNSSQNFTVFTPTLPSMVPRGGAASALCDCI